MFDYILIGLEDGSLHLYDLTKNFGKSYIITQTNGKQLSSPYDQYLESNYEHHDAIVSIETNPALHLNKDASKNPEQNFILTASKDGIIMLWSINAMANHSEDEEMLIFNSELNVK